MKAGLILIKLLAYSLDKVKIDEIQQTNVITAGNHRRILQWNSCPRSIEFTGRWNSRLGPDFEAMKQ